MIHHIVEWSRVESNVDEIYARTMWLEYGFVWCLCYDVATDEFTLAGWVVEQTVLSADRKVNYAPANHL